MHSNEFHRHYILCFCVTLNTLLTKYFENGTCKKKKLNYLNRNKNEPRILVHTEGFYRLYKIEYTHIESLYIYTTLKYMFSI